MPHEPGHEECPPPYGGGFRPLHPDQRVQIGTTGCFRAVYGDAGEGMPGSQSLDCGAIVTWVWPIREGERRPRVNVTLFLNTNSGTGGSMQKREIPLWGVQHNY